MNRKRLKSIRAWLAAATAALGLLAALAKLVETVVQMAHHI
jgi:hypothetical protein